MIINFGTVIWKTIFSIIPKLCFWLIIITQTIFCLLLIFLILLQKNDDGGIGSVFMRTSILYNRSENLFTRKIIIFLSSMVLFGCLGLSVYFYKINKNKYAIEQIINDYSN